MLGWSLPGRASCLEPGRATLARSGSVRCRASPGTWGAGLPLGKVTKQTLLYRGFIGSVGLIRSISVLNPATVNKKVLGGEGLPLSVLCCSN